MAVLAHARRLAQRKRLDPGCDRPRLPANGAVEHLADPEFHGDPLSGGVVCFHHFGWDLLADIRAAGFSDVTACRVQSLADGLPQGLWVLRALR